MTRRVPSPHAVKPRILLVEDEEAISEPLAESLERDGFAAEVVATLERSPAKHSSAMKRILDPPGR